MKLSLGKKVTIIAVTIVALALLTIAGVLAAGMINKHEVNISSGDLSEMKTLAHKYLNERNRVVVSADPDNNPKIANAPIIDPSEMSPELAERQKEDVEKLIARADPGCWDDFAIFLRLTDVREEVNNTILFFRNSTFYHIVPPGPTVDPNYPKYSGEGYDFYCAFTRDANRWILLDVKMTNEFGDQPTVEPSVIPREGGEDVLVDPSEDKDIPEKIQRLDEEATKKIMNEWAINEKTKYAIKEGTYPWN